MPGVHHVRRDVRHLPVAEVRHQMLVRSGSRLEGMTGIEPPPSVWKTDEMTSGTPSHSPGWDGADVVAAAARDRELRRVDTMALERCQPVPRPEPRWARPDPWTRNGHRRA